MGGRARASTRRHADTPPRRPADPANKPGTPLPHRRTNSRLAAARNAGLAAGSRASTRRPAATRRPATTYHTGATNSRLEHVRGGVAAGRSAQRACERSSDWRRGAAGSPDPGNSYRAAPISVLTVRRVGHRSLAAGPLRHRHRCRPEHYVELPRQVVPLGTLPRTGSSTANSRSSIWPLHRAPGRPPNRPAFRYCCVHFS
jgi:hypothetical protein